MRLALKKRREELKLTQEELAEKIEIARSTYTNIELGEKNPSLKVAIKLKQELHYFNDDIFFNSTDANGDIKRMNVS